MADQKITELVEKTILETGDLLVTVDMSGVPTTKKILAENAGISDGELHLTPKASSTGAEGTLFYCSEDDSVYVGTEV